MRGDDAAASSGGMFWCWLDGGAEAEESVFRPRGTQECGGVRGGVMFEMVSMGTGAEGK